MYWICVVFQEKSFVCTQISSSETSSLLVIDPSTIIAKERGHISGTPYTNTQSKFESHPIDLLSCPPGFSEGMTFKTPLRNTADGPKGKRTTSTTTTFEKCPKEERT